MQITTAAVISYDVFILCNFVIPPVMESDLALHVKTFSDMFQGLTVEKCKQVAPRICYMKHDEGAIFRV